MLKEIAGILAEIAPGEGYKFYDRVAGEIVSLFKAEVDKLTVIDMRAISSKIMADGAKRKNTVTYSPKYFTQNKIQLKITANTQLQSTKKQLLDLMEGQ